MRAICRNWATLILTNASSISIYPKNFESKEHVVSILDGYNDTMEKEGKNEQVISYTDMVGTLMSSVTDIVNIISYVLIAFVGISLVVSSIMIGVITYISVLERKKEIGILRAIGASKRNISQVFNAETFIIGLCAGLIGIGLSLLLMIPGNLLIHHLADTTEGQCFSSARPGACSDCTQRRSDPDRRSDSVEESGKKRSGYGTPDRII